MSRLASLTFKVARRKKKFTVASRRAKLKPTREFLLQLVNSRKASAEEISFLNGDSPRREFAPP